MLEKLLNLPDEFWHRLLIIFLAYTGAQIALRVLTIPLPIDNSLLLSVFIICSLIGIFLIPKLLVNPFLNYIIVQLMFFWIVVDQFLKKTLHLSVKPHAFIFGFALLVGSIYFFKNFKFLWKFITFRFFFVFFIINIIYYFYHYSTFNINSLNLAGVGGISGNQSAKTVVFLDSLAVLLSSIIPLSLIASINNKYELDSIVCTISKILCYCFISFAILFPFIIQSRIAGTQIYLPIYFLLMLGFKYYIDNLGDNTFITTKFSNLMTFSFLVLFGISIINCNKTALIGILFATFIFVFINHKLHLKLNIIKTIDNKKIGIVYGLLLSIVLFYIAVKFNIPEIIQSKLKETFNAVTGGGTTSFAIRKSNWNLFMNYWTNHLDLSNSLFGFGLGKSREIMYFLSKSQYSPIYFVQTTHNQYMETFFDYGAVALFYYTPFVLIFYQNVINLLTKAVHNNLKLLSNLSCCLIIFYFIYHYSDGLRIPTAIIFFSALMLIEGLKYKLQNFENYTVQGK